MPYCHGWRRRCNFKEERNRDGESIKRLFSPFSPLSHPLQFELNNKANARIPRKEVKSTGSIAK